MGNNKAAIWLRVSTKQQETEAQGLACIDKARELGLTVEYTHDLTGSAYKNQYDPEADKLVNICKRLGIGHLIIFDLSRLSRSGGFHSLTMVHKFQRANINVHSCDPTEQFIDIDGIDGIVAQIKGYLNRSESELKSRRIKSGVEARRQNGEQVGRGKGSKDKRPRETYGYKLRWLKNYNPTTR